MEPREFVVHQADGTWAVKVGNSEKATAIFKVQKEAIKLGRKIAINNNRELTIQGKDGKFRESNSYGNDPREIKG